MTFIIVGYSIFIVTGNLPECEADVLLKVLPANQPVKPRLINEKNIDKKDVDSDLKQALNASKKDVDTDDKILQETLKKSMEGYFYDEDVPNTSMGRRNTAGATPSQEDNIADGKTIATPSQDEIRSKRLAFLSKIDGTGTSTSDKSDNTQPEKCNGCDKTDETSELICQQNNDEGNEEDMLKQAIAMSMEGHG